MIPIATRDSWGARYPNGDLTLYGSALEVFVHHTVTATLPVDADPDDEREQMRALESIGQSRFGTGISYNCLIFPSGRPYQGVSWNRRGTHTGGRNSTARSISFAGNFEAHEPSDLAILTAAAIFEAGKGVEWRSTAPLRAHRDVSQTACPGKNLYARLGEIRKGADLVDNPVNPPASDPTDLVVDGYWGKNVTRRLQKVLGTPVDGIVSSQEIEWAPSNPGLTTGWDWDQYPQGSRLISEMQRVMGLNRDGILGPVFVRALQRRMGTPVDGVLSAKSKAIMAMQRRLNDGKF
jgi:hypothetical protein